MSVDDSAHHMRVCLIEDDAELREEMEFSLGELGLHVQGFGSAAEFYRALVTSRCDVAVIDVGLPGEDGFSIASHLRKAGCMGIVMLTARNTLDDRLRGLQEGADAYLVKPIDMRELLATLHAVARRLPTSVAPAVVAREGAWQLVDGGWRLRDPAGKELPLTASERALLQCLFEHLGRPVTRDQLIEAVGGDVYDFDPHRIDSLASRLRRKANSAGMNISLRAVRGVGYVLSGGHSSRLK